MNDKAKAALVLVLPWLAGILVAGCAGPRLTLGRTPEGEVIDVVGEAPLDAGDLSETRRRSVLDAKKNAVEMAVGVQVSAKTRVEQSALIESKILTRSDGYILRYEVLKQWKESPLYKTKIRALVAYQRLGEDLRSSGLLHEPQVGNPRVAVLLTETVKGGDETPTFAGDALGRALAQKGFRVVDRADLMAARATEVQKQVDQGDTSGMASLSKKLDAEILIFGSVEGAPMENTGLDGVVSIRSTLSAKAYKSESNEVLASVAKAASGMDSQRGPAVMKSFTKAGEMAGEELPSALLEALKRRAYVSVTIYDLDGLERLQQVERALSSARGVQDVFLRLFVGGEAHMDVEVDGISSQDVSHALEQDSDLGVKVKAVTPEIVEASVE